MGGGVLPYCALPPIESAVFLASWVRDFSYVSGGKP